MAVNLKQQQERLGMSKLNKEGELITITRYDRNNDIDITFEDGTTIKAEYIQFKRGTIRNTFNRLGKENYNNDGLLMKIIEYNDHGNIVVQFEDGYKKKTRYAEFKDGSVKNPYYKFLYNRGFYGEGKYTTKINGIDTKYYTVWHNMFYRVYGDNRSSKNSSYKNCKICKEWCNFQTFAEWFEENYYELDDEQVQIDKDIINKDSYEYSPENCVFLPVTLNKTLINRRSRNKNYPIGTSYNKKNGKIRSQIKKLGIVYSLGEFNSKEEAFNAYKIEKEKHIKEITSKYKGKIPNQAYNALMNWEIKIDD